MAKKNTLFGKPRNQVIKRPGAFKARAKKAGMGTMALAQKYARKNSKASKLAKAQARLVLVFANMRKQKGEP